MTAAESHRMESETHKRRINMIRAIFPDSVFQIFKISELCRIQPLGSPLTIFRDSDHEVSPFCVCHGCYVSKELRSRPRFPEIYISLEFQRLVLARGLVNQAC